MAEPVEIFRYIRYLRLRWRWIALSAAVSLALAFAITLLQPKQYTATARVLIEPPAGSDPRSSMAITPIYLESLRTYEQFASSDSLFQKALNRFEMRSREPIESVKKRVLKVGLVRNTRVLEISARMTDARAAQALAQYVAEATVELTGTMVQEGDRDLAAGLEQQQIAAQAKFQEADQAWSKAVASEPVDELRTGMESASALRAEIRKELASEELQIADAADREKQAPPDQVAFIRRDVAVTRARLAEMRRQIEDIDRRQAERERTLAQRVARREQFETARKTRQAELAAVETRLQEVNGNAGYRGERMKIIDPGIVPQRPSSPKLTLNLLAALLLGLVLPVLYLAFEMNYREQRIVRRHTDLPAYMRSGDE